MQTRIRHIALWLATFVGSIAYAQSPLFEQFSTEQGLPDATIIDLVLSPSGNIWIAQEQKLVQFDGFSFQEMKSEALDGPVAGLTMGPQGDIWVYSERGSLYVLNEGKLQAHPANSKLQVFGEQIAQIHVNAKGLLTLSMSGGKGLVQVHRDSNTIKALATTDYPAGGFVKELPDGSMICGSLSAAPTSNRLSVLFESGTYTLNLLSDKAASTCQALPLDDGNLLYTQGVEAVILNRNSVVARAFLEDEIAYSLQDSQGRIWLAFKNGGLNCYPEGRITPKNELNYLSTHQITAVAEDPSGNIWIGTSDAGLFYMPSQPALTYVAPQVYSSTSDSDSVARPVIQQPVEIAQQLPETEQAGIAVAHQDTIPPVVYISGMTIRERDTIVQEHYDLPYDFAFLKIRYVGFAADNPDVLQFRYRLLGLSEQWAYTSNTEVQFTSLDPGTYNFELYAMNKYGIWSQSPATLSFTIQPPIWLTWWFQLAAVLSGILLVGGGFWGYSHRLKRKEQERAAFTQQLAQMELQALRAQMNPHFMFNTLSSIQHYITTNDTEPALRYLSKFAKLMRRIIENSKNAVIPLQDEIDALELYLELEALRFKNKFDYRIDVGEGLDLHYDAVPSMLIQPYVENAILHGLTRKEGQGLLSIRLQKQGESILCEVEDDGIGRKAAAAYNKTRKSTHKSRGLSITEERLKILNRANHNNLHVELIDLENEAGEALGTKVRIVIPLKP